MEKSCFHRKGSDPPVCGVHNVTLFKTTLRVDPNDPNSALVPFFICPIGRGVVDVDAGQAFR
jgi:hypothetical protein